MVDYLAGDVKNRALALAAAIQLCPNYLLVKNWLSTEPHAAPSARPDEDPANAEERRPPIRQAAE